MKFLLLLTFFILILNYSSTKAEDKEEDYVSPFCPTIHSLNTTTRFHYGRSLGRLITDEYYSDDLSRVGVDLQTAPEKLRLLTTETDSAVCQKLNELFLNMKPTREVYDNELNTFVPAWFEMYYQFDDKYLVVRHPYTPGTSDGEIGFGVMGGVNAFFFDKKNLNYIGNFSF